LDALPTTAPRPPSRAADPSHEALVGLVWTLVRTDFKARYHSSLSGFVWALLKPLVMFLALLAVFSFVFSSQENYRSDLLVGLFLWEFFAESTKTGLISLQMKGFLLTKAKFPRWIVVVTAISNPLLTLFIFSAAMVGYLALIGHPPSVLRLALFVLYVLAFVLLAVSVSLATSVLFLRYRDLNQVWDVVCQAGFFLTPIIWPIGSIPERFHLYLFLWPPTAYIDFARQVLIAGTLPTLRANLLLAGATLVSLAIGIAIFRRLAPRAAEYL